MVTRYEAEMPIPGVGGCRWRPANPDWRWHEADYFAQHRRARARREEDEPADSDATGNGEATAAPAPAPSFITTTPAPLAWTGDEYVYHPKAYDGRTVGGYRWRLIASPPGMTIDQDTGILTWIPGKSSSTEVTLSVRNIYGTESRQTWRLRARHPGVLRPTDADRKIAAQRQTLPPTPDRPLVRTPPVVSWNVPGNFVVDKPFDLSASVRDPNSDIVTWTLTMQSKDTGVTRTLATGSGAVTNAFLAGIDPAEMANGPYVLTLRAVDGAGHETALSQVVTVRSQYKVGNFNLSFQDMQVNLGGIPIVIQRTYDTFDAGRSGDFGHGWSMSYIPVSLKDNIGVDLRKDPTSGLYQSGNYGDTIPIP